MNAQIINAFGRKPGDPLPGAEETKVEICENSVKLLEYFLGLAKEGALAGVAVGAVVNGYPTCSITGPGHHDARDFAVLALANRMAQVQIEALAMGNLEMDNLEEDEE
jgi:hypothetical protein